MIQLDKIIELCGLSDEEVARLLDISRPTVTRWRRKETSPHEAIIDRIIQKIIIGSEMSKEDLQLYINNSDEIEKKLEDRKGAREA